MDPPWPDELVLSRVPPAPASPPVSAVVPPEPEEVDEPRPASDNPFPPWPPAPPWPPPFELHATRRPASKSMD